MLSDDNAAKPLWILNNSATLGKVPPMRQHTLLLAFALALIGSAASAACTVEYKAKKGSQYVHTRMSVPDSACSVGAATPIVESALASQGMQLLAIVKVTPGG